MFKSLYVCIFQKSGSDVVLGNSSNEEVLVIPPNTLEPNTTYIAELTVSKEGRAPETTTQTVINLYSTAEFGSQQKWQIR